MLSDSQDRAEPQVARARSQSYSSKPQTMPAEVAAAPDSSALHRLRAARGTDALGGLLARAVSARAAVAVQHSTDGPLIQRVMTKVKADTDVDLTEHETWGGHTIERHVAKSADFIQSRVIGQELDAASTFPDLATANTVATAGVRANAGEINTILYAVEAGAANRAFQYTADRDIGQFLEHGNVLDKKGRERKKKALKSGAQSATVVVRIVWQPQPPHQWYLLTCFPNPTA